MTTPSQSIDQVIRSGPVTISRWHGRKPGEVFPIPPLNTSDLVVGANRNVRPVSVTSPVRPDGTRAPRPWERRWGVMRAPSRAISWQYGEWPSYHYWYGWHFVGPAVAPGTLDSLLSACGASWSRSVSPGSFPYGAEAQARTNFRNTLMDGKADWGVTLGEMRSTIKGVRQYAESTLGLIEAMAAQYRRRKRDVVDLLMGIPPRTRRAPSWYRNKDRLIIDNWLQFQFAAKPLLGDIQTSAEALSWLLFDERRPMRMKFKAGGSDSRSQSVLLAGATINTIRGRTRMETTEQCHISAVYDIEPTGTRTFQQLGLTNPLSVAWELTPFSWGVDYVTNVGKWLSSLARIEGASFVEGSLTRIQRTKTITTTQLEIASPGLDRWDLLEGFDPYPFSCVAGRMSRTVLTSAVEAAVRPAYKNRLGLTRMANALGVISNLLR